MVPSHAAAYARVVPSDRLPPPPAGDDRGVVLAGADRLLDLLTAVPGHRDEAVAVVNGFFGDSLAEVGSSLTTPMTLRSADGPLLLERRALADALPRATGRLCLLVHGLMSTESVWQFPGDPDTNYGTLLARDHGVTPLWLRYNTGRHISVNGRELARLLHRLVAVWPRRVKEIALIGHSMGGLVIRSACHYARVTRQARGLARLRRPWTAKVRRIVLIGVPNTGAPLEVLASLVSGTLWSVPTPATRIVSRGLDARSAGIKDLRFGAIRDDDWTEPDPDLAAPTPPVPPPRLSRAAYLLVAGSVTADPDHPLARVIGDVLVTWSSASGTIDGETGEGLFPGAAVRLFPKVTHLALANRPEVYGAIDEWWP